MKTLYKNLMALCTNEATTAKFYFSDAVGLPHAGLKKYRTFAYHVASYSDWLLPGALEARGIMFEIDEYDEPIRIASRPDPKFFNLNENPFTMNLDLTTVEGIFDKADGSLINSYTDGEYLRLKSKTSLISNQAQAANEYIIKKENEDLFNFVEDCEGMGYTVNMEWTAPNNRIVLGYDEPKLVILNIRHRETGEYLKFDDIPDMTWMHIKDWLVDEFDHLEAHEPDFVDTLRAKKGIEGVVLQFPDMKVKLKTDWYVQLHSNKDSISNPKRFVITVLDGNHDDLRAMFHDDPETLTRIQDFETKVVDTVAKGIQTVLLCYDANRGKSRKDYAIAGQEALDSYLFGVYMRLFDGIGDKDVAGMVTEAYKRVPEQLIPGKYLL